MSVDLLTRLERALEHIFESLFSHGFKGRVQPVEIARRLTRAMEDHKMVSVSQVFVPNEFTVALHPEDYRTLSPFEAAIMPDLVRHVEESAAEANYGLLGKPVIRLKEDPTVERGGTRIDAGFLRKEDQTARVPDTPTTALKIENAPPLTGRQAVLVVIEGPDAGQEFSLRHGMSTIGRGGVNDVALSDTSVSRAHAQIELQPDGYHLKDLGSKNGSLVNGLPAVDTLLAHGDEIVIGATIFEFRAARVV
ncbi:MAG TPA: DUF3662 and FHA domain-containing protein [Armatimonadota bacterium]|nr:DUF3662 and FHA domain-containing protein [Armatimonadota bacterium]